MLWWMDGMSLNSCIVLTVVSALGS